MRIVWFGLGRFGAPMARHFVSTGHALAVPQNGHAVTATRELLLLGATALSRQASADVYVTCLRSPAEVAEVADSLQPPYPRLFVDFSTGSPAAAVELVASLRRVGVRYVDSPVSGSIEAAGSGELTTWVGASEHDIDDALRHVLETAARHVYPMGRVGAGCAAKLVNQVIHIANVAALGEGLALARAQGLDLDSVVESLRRSSADSVMLRRFGRTIAEESFEPRFALSLALKDLRFATDAAQTAGLSLDFAEEVKRRLEVLSGQGHGDLDFTLLTSLSAGRSQ